MHTFEIKQMEGASNIMTGMNTIFLIDGKKVEGCRKVSFEVDARGEAVVTVELYGHMHINGSLEDRQLIVKDIEASK